jgi:hypothetical protein
MRAIPDAPPLTPEAGEIIIPAEAFMTKACLEALRSLSREGAQFGSPLLMTSARWGKVWRIDFAIPGFNVHGVVNRAVCYLPPNRIAAIVIAPGQHIAPLPR